MPDDQASFYRDIYDFAARQVSESRASFERYYKTTIAGMLLVAGIAIGAFFFLVGREYRDISSNVEANVRSKADAHFAELDNEIRQRISKQFEEKKLKELIQQAAVEQTKKGLDEVVLSAISRSVEARVKAEEPLIRETVTSETKKGVAALSPTISSAVQSETRSVEQRIQAQMAPYGNIITAGTLATLARNGSGDAYDKLMAMASASNNTDIKMLALTTRNSLFLEYDLSLSIYNQRSFTTPHTREELHQLLDNPDPMARKAAIDTLVSQGDKSIVPQLLHMMEVDPFIIVREASYRGLSDLTGQKFQPFEIDAWKTWWTTAKNSWPK